MDEHTTDARPMQVRIADDLRNQINRGELAPGDRLPTLGALAERHGVSEMVARRAVELLRQEGAVISRKGSGKIGRASCREREGSSVGAGLVKKKIERYDEKEGSRESYTDGRERGE